MDLENAITTLARRQNKERSAAARPGHKYYDAARDVDFQECRCYAASHSGYIEYIGRGPRGGVHYVGHARFVTVGPKGLHWADGSQPCV